jgi:ATP-binding cassette subfamily B (MDR/TAP) protein 1
MMPIFLIITGVTGKILASGYAKSIGAYSQSSGYAEQCLGSFRLVAAFGNEKIEMDNYYGHLETAKEAGKKQKTQGAIGIAIMFFAIYCCYSYAFYVGSHFVEGGVYNGGRGRPYTFGDVISCFFGILFGLFSFANASNHMKGIVEARVAGKFAFDIIDKVTPIKLEEPGKKEHAIQGHIEFKNVNFRYPTRTDQQILKNLNLSFEQGKMTAIVGPSGSGKSTIIQLIERFYDCEDDGGEVLIDGTNIKDIQLRHYRSQIGYVAQEPIMLNASFRKNLQLGKPDATEEEINEALESTNSMDFIKEKGGIDKVG